MVAGSRFVVVCVLQWEEERERKELEEKEEAKGGLHLEINLSTATNVSFM